MVNNTENKTDKKKKTYFADRQKRYGDKCKVYHVKYIPTEFDSMEAIEKALSVSGMSANAWIKLAIREKLERDGFM